jgi:phosphatidate phosphatase APP1
MANSKLISVFIFLISFNIYSSDLVVISDFDDTIKQTNVQSTTGAIFNGVFTKKAFAGMNSLFDSMDSYTSGLYILSNSPNLLRFKIFKLIVKHGLNPIEVSTRNIIKDRDGFKYKYDYVVSKIKELNSKVVLIGDDVGEDPEVYAKVKEDYPGLVDEIYIHVVKHREIPSGITDYITSFDIAINEYKKERMNLNQVMMLGNELAVDYSMKNVIPKFSFCPKDSSRWDSINISELANLIQETTRRIVNHCQGKGRE